MPRVDNIILRFVRSLAAAFLALPVFITVLALALSTIQQLAHLALEQLSHRNHCTFLLHIASSQEFDSFHDHGGSFNSANACQHSHLREGRKP